MSDYSVEICKKLQAAFGDTKVYRPMAVERYDDGDELVYEAQGVEETSQPKTGRVTLTVDKFVGGGFAGQVYRVKVKAIEGGPIGGLAVGETYALKVLIPPSRASVIFRDVLYWIGFQGPFQLQVNPTAARAGALWQKFIRRAAAARFGDTRCVNNVHAILVDRTLGSCGEISDWVDGRTWRLEVDNYVDMLGRWESGRKVAEDTLGSPEYRAKKTFMREFVNLLHEMGGHEFARQYEWSTWKSQPNCLKRLDTEGDPAAGLTAVDFRAGLTLLPFLPMSFGDVPLIFKGILRGSLVQFDRGNLRTLEKYVRGHSEIFEGMEGTLGELKEAERLYRDSIPDITHNHVRLLFSPKLWGTIVSSAITGWRVTGLVDEHAENMLRRNGFAAWLFVVIGCVPFLGKVMRKAWCNAAWRKHYGSLLTSPSYLWQAVKAKMAELAISWHRAERIDEQTALRVGTSFPTFMFHLPFSFLPPGVHKFFTNWSFFKEKLHFIFVRPFRLYFDHPFREQWLRDMVIGGREKGIITSEDADEILSQLSEPFIQKYLKSLAVHVLTFPVTQVVSLAVAWLYIRSNPDMTVGEASVAFAGIIAAFQVIPISPGSIVRGLYVTYVVIRERNIKDYSIAMSLGFFKYIGYLSFPIQMAYRYSTLARFMASHWATDAVHVVPVFGESGALLEHHVFNLFYNWPLTLRRRIGARMEMRKKLKPRVWHAPLWVVGMAGLFGLADYFFVTHAGRAASLKDLMPLIGISSLVLGAVLTLGAGGLSLSKRILLPVIAGIALGALCAVAWAYIGGLGQDDLRAILTMAGWHAFFAAVLGVIGAIGTELLLPDPVAK